MKDLANNVNVTQSIAPAALASDTNGTGVDLQGYGSATVLLDVGVEGITLQPQIKLILSYKKVVMIPLILRLHQQQV